MTLARTTRTVITYGTFDLFHVGHLNLLKRMRALGDRLIVGVSTDQFNEGKGKKTVVPFRDRISIVESIKYVDLAIPEESWHQKKDDIRAHCVDVFGMGDDWLGKFDDLKDECEVVYLPRTADISSTEFKKLLSILDAEHVTDLKKALDMIAAIVHRFE